MKELFLLLSVFVFIGCGVMNNPKRDSLESPGGGANAEDAKVMAGEIEVTLQNATEFASEIVSDFYLINKIQQDYGDFEKKIIDANHSIVSFASNYEFDNIAIYPKSTINIDDDFYTLNVQGKHNNLSLYRTNVTYKVTQDTTTFFQLISGLSNNYFKADELKKDKQIPFEIDQQGDLQIGGLFYYIADANRSLILQATNINEITVKIDLNSDKMFDINETKTLKIKAN